MPSIIKRIFQIVLCGVILPVMVVGGSYTLLCLQRPAQEDRTEKLAEGIVYQRFFYEDPRPVMVHLIEFDLSQAVFQWFVTPPVDPTERVTTALTTKELAERFDLSITVNGSHFDPFWSKSPWNFYPRSGDPVDIMGYAVSDGVLYSENRSQWPKFCFQGMRMQVCGNKDVHQMPYAIAGGRLLLRWGNVSPNMDGPLPEKPLPRTVVGYSKDGSKAWLVVVDGRQKGYSEGLSLFEMGAYMKDLGADFVLNLDGGGSSTLVVKKDGKQRVLNAPYHTYIPMRQRAVGNALGVKLPQLENES